MGLLDKLKDYKEKKLKFKLPDGSEIGLRPVVAAEVLPRLGLPPQVLAEFMGMGEVEEEVRNRQVMQSLQEKPELIEAGLRWEEAYWVFGIDTVEGQPANLCFSHERDTSKTPVSVFKATIAEAYGEKVVDELSAAIKRASSYTLPEEVEADAEAFQDVAGDAALSGEDLRHEPDRAPEA